MLHCALRHECRTVLHLIIDRILSMPLLKLKLCLVKTVNVFIMGLFTVWHDIVVKAL